MSEIQSKSIPIPKSNKYINSQYTYPNSNNGYTHFMYSLTINENLPKHQIFTKVEKHKHCILIDEFDKINYNDIKTFHLHISTFPINFNYIYELSGIINHEQSSYNQQENGVYIEFSQNSSGNIFCRSSFIDVDFNKICISPPN